MNRRYIFPILLYIPLLFSTQESIYFVSLNETSPQFKKIRYGMECIIEDIIVDIKQQNITSNDIEAWVDSHIIEDDGTDECFLKAVINIILLDIASFLREIDNEKNDNMYSLDEFVNQCNCS